MTHEMIIGFVSGLVPSIFSIVMVVRTFFKNITIDKTIDLLEKGAKSFYETNKKEVDTIKQTYSDIIIKVTSLVDMVEDLYEKNKEDIKREVHNITHQLADEVREIQGWSRDHSIQVQGVINHVNNVSALLQKGQVEIPVDKISDNRRNNTDGEISDTELEDSPV